MHNRILTCLLLVLLLPAAVLAQTATRPATPTAPAATPAPPPPPLASVNGSPISQAHLDAAIAGRWAGPIMKTIIDDRLVRQEARRLKLKATPQEVQSRYKAAVEKASSVAAFQRSLARQGFSGPGYIEYLTTEILLEKLLARLTAVGDEDARKFYEAHKAEYANPAELNLFTITVLSIEDAYLVRERLAAGEKFDAVARELSQDVAREKGGDNGWVRAAGLPEKAYADALFAMEPGVVSSPLRLGSKYVIALVKERKPEKFVSFEQAKKGIVTKLQGEKSVRREDYLTMLERKAGIVVTWPPAKFLNAEFGRLREIRVIVDGEPLDLDTPPVRLPNGQIIVPAKPLLQALDAKLVWKASEQSLTASNLAGKVKLVVGATRAIVGETTLEAKDMSEAPVMRNGVLFISPRVPLAALGATLQWNALENALVVESLVQDMPSPTVPANRSGLEKQP